MDEATARGSKWARLREQSRDGLQLVIRKGDTYDEVGVYKLSPLNVYLVVSAVLVVTALLVGALIAFTPLRQYIPGYGDVVQRQEVREMRNTLAELTTLVEGQEAYIENLKRTVLGEAITVDSIREDHSAVVTLDGEPLAPSEGEIQVRREMEAERSIPETTGVSTLPVTGTDAGSLAQVYLVAPVNGEISAGFNLVKEHLGVDVLAARNTAIKSTRAGVVFMAEFTNSYGNVIGIQHDNNLISFYKHNSQLLKNVGDRVKAGEAIAIIGDTGTESTGPHLHFELWYAGRAVDPGDYISF